MRFSSLVRFSFSLLLLICSNLYAQEDDRYFIGDEEKLQIIVHVLGEVKRPGEYRVPDNTNLIEIISKSGGANEYSNMSNIIITRNRSFTSAQDSLLPVSNKSQKIILYFDLDEYLTNVDSDPPPLLEPGDIIYVPKNKWSTWTTVSAVVRDMAVVASAYFLYLRLENN